MNFTKIFSLILKKWPKETIWKRKTRSKNSSMRNSGIEFDSQHVIVTLFQNIVDSKSHKSQLKKYYISYICNITNGAIIVTYGSCIMTTKVGFSKHLCFIKIVMVPLAFLSSFSFSVKKATGNTSFGLVLSVFYSAVFSNLLSNRTSARN